MKLKVWNIANDSEKCFEEVSTNFATQLFYSAFLTGFENPVHS